MCSPTARPTPAAFSQSAQLLYNIERRLQVVNICLVTPAIRARAIAWPSKDVGLSVQLSTARHIAQEPDAGTDRGGAPGLVRPLTHVEAGENCAWSFRERGRVGGLSGGWWRVGEMVSIWEKWGFVWVLVYKRFSYVVYCRILKFFFFFLVINLNFYLNQQCDWIFKQYKKHVEEYWPKFFSHINK